MDEQNFISAALFFGCIAGISPGPLMALIIAETMKQGKATGIKIAFAPLITDLPIMALSIFVLSQLAFLHVILGLISFGGGVYLLYLAYENITLRHVKMQPLKTFSSLRKVILTNFLNPGPYVFFFSIGGPMIVSATRIHGYNTPLFISLFFTTFITINVAIAFGVHGFKFFFHSRQYLYALRLVGIVLLFFSISLFHQSLQYVGLLK